MIKKIWVTDDPKEFCRPEFFSPVFSTPCLSSGPVMRDILQSRYLRSNGAHKQLARTSLIERIVRTASVDI